MIDHDIVVESNINRQCQANYNNLGKAKVLAMKQILKEINPGIIVTTIEEEFTFFNAKIESAILSVLSEALIKNK